MGPISSWQIPPGGGVGLPPNGGTLYQPYAGPAWAPIPRRTPANLRRAAIDARTGIKPARAERITLAEPCRLKLLPSLSIYRPFSFRA